MNSFALEMGLNSNMFRKKCKAFVSIKFEKNFKSHQLRAVLKTYKGLHSINNRLTPLPENDFKISYYYR